MKIINTFLAGRGGEEEKEKMEFLLLFCITKVLVFIFINQI